MAEFTNVEKQFIDLRYNKCLDLTHISRIMRASQHTVRRYAMSVYLKLDVVSPEYNQRGTSYVMLMRSARKLMKLGYITLEEI